MARARRFYIPFRIRPTRLRLSLLSILLSLYGLFYLFFSGPHELPEDLVTSSIYHGPDSSDPMRIGGRIARNQRGTGGDSIGLAFESDGMVKGWDVAHALMLKAGLLPKGAKKRVKEIRDRHPIEDLMARGRKRWQLLLSSQSKTLPQAVTEYVRRYKRPPPKGFEVWWQFCKRNGVKIVDDYDQINRDIEPYFAISPAEFQTRAGKLDTQEHSYQISLSPSSTPAMTGVRANSPRGIHLFHLLAPLSDLLPGPIKITVSDHDMGNWMIGDDQYKIANQAIEHKRFLTSAELQLFEDKQARGAAKGLMSACGKGSLGWNVTIAKQRGQVVPPKLDETTFIHDPLPTYDLCTNPTILKVHGTHSYDFARESILRPLFQLSKFTRDPSFLTTPLEAYDNHTSSVATTKYSPWNEKDINQIFWRGSSTGDHYSKRKGYDWHESHRMKLHFMANPGLLRPESKKDEKVGIWVERGNSWEWGFWRKDKVAKYYMDVGLSGQPHQCSIEDGTCDDMVAEIDFRNRVRPEESVKYKYVDGNGWSSRFHRLLMSGAMVIKATIYQEWQSDLMIPWYHYVPTQIDYSDLYNILSFFIGPPDGKKGGHDHLAQQIAEQGRQFGIEHWRWEDMQAYMFRLLLEYSRLMADDRDEASYQKTYNS